MSEGFARLDAKIDLMRSEMLARGQVHSSGVETPLVPAPEEHLSSEAAAAVSDLDEQLNLHPIAAWEPLPDQARPLLRRVFGDSQDAGKSAHDASVKKAERLMGDSGEATNVSSTSEVLPKKSPKPSPRGRGGQAPAFADGAPTSCCAITDPKLCL